MRKEKRFPELGKKAYLEAAESVCITYGIEPEDTIRYPDIVLKHTLLNLVTHFESTEPEKKSEAACFLSELRSALENDETSMPNLLVPLHENIARLPPKMIGGRCLMYRTFTALLCLPRFQPFNLNKHIHEERLELRRRVSELEITHVKAISSEAHSDDEQWDVQQDCRLFKTVSRESAGTGVASSEGSRSDSEGVGFSSVPDA